MKKQTIMVILWALWALVLSSPLQADPIGTAFTYQGRLTDGGNPANGTHDFEFYLYDAATGGNQLGVRTLEEIPVIDGVFTVELDFEAGAFDGQRRWLEIWVRNSTDGQAGETLVPRQEITAAPYAQMASKVPANAITDVELANGAVTSAKLADGAVTSGKIASGAVTGSNIANGAITSANISNGAIQSQNLATGSVGASQLASGAVTGDKLGSGAAYQNLLANGQSPVGSTGVIMSQLAAAPELLAAGYQLAGQATLVEEAWSTKAPAPDGPPAFNLASERTAAVWTGTEMLVWGGSSNVGGRYNPITKIWTPMSTVNAPAARLNPTAVWTGTEMIVWGGYDGNFLNTGGRYNPATDTWTPLPTAGAPSGRRYHTAVWTGSRMIIWGGTTAGGSAVADGAQYHPSTNTWSTLSTSGTPSAPLARTRHAAFWHSGENAMYVAGGVAGFDDRVDRYSPSTNTWTQINPTSFGLIQADNIEAFVWTGAKLLMIRNSPAVLSYTPSSNTLDVIPSPYLFGERSTMIWDGTRAVIWGENTNETTAWATFNPATGTFGPVSLESAPPNRVGHVAVWTGSRMIVWGGFAGLSGGSYDPAADTWEPVTGLSEGGRRSRGFSQVWTGSDMLIWGGIDGGGSTVRGGLRYNLAANTWTILSNTNAPSARLDHSAVWTGSEMILWGGRTADGEDFFYDGARYNPATDTWVTLPVPGAPNIEGQRAVWTGAEMLLVGSASGGFMQGARYNPSTNAWTALSTANAPANRAEFTLVWTGTEAIVWGGINGTTGNATGARYNPATNTWTTISSSNAPPGRANPAAVWTGTEMILFGGGSESGPYPTVNARYNPATDTWTTLNATNAPDARRDMSYAWDGSRLIVWGGKSESGTLFAGNSAGKLYSPFEDQWSPVTTTSAPGASSGAKAVWTGSSMLMFGGEDGTGNALNTTHSYIPERSFHFYVRP